jgi:hypothetical protein
MRSAEQALSGATPTNCIILADVGVTSGYARGKKVQNDFKTNVYSTTKSAVFAGRHAGRLEVLGKGATWC